jgi:hypothetical protein
LAATLAQQLAARGLPDNLHMLADGYRIVIASAHRAVRDAELGTENTAPRGVLEQAARTAVPDVLRAMVAALHRSVL